MPALELFSDDELDQLAAATLEVLERSGLMYQSERVLAALEAAGALVDRAQQRARLPRRLLEALLASRPRPRTAPAPRRTADLPLPGIGLQVAQFYYDHERQQRRPGNREDLVQMIRLGDALEDGQPVSQVLILREEPPLVEPLEALALLLEHSSRPGDTYPYCAAQFPYLEEIGAIWAGDARRFLGGGIFMVSPLRMGERAAEYVAAMTSRELPVGVGTMPVSGVSAPVTTAGAIVVGAADILGGWAAAWALAPELPLSGSICSGSVDMATGTVSFSSPESMLQDIGCAELFRRRFGGGVGIAGGADYTSAKFPGYQAGFEKAFEAMAIAAYTGGRPRLGAGLLDSGKTFSPLQLLIDREFQGMLNRFAAGAPVDGEQLAAQVIADIGSGLSKSHLESEHTLRHFRQALWFPRLLDRRPWDEAGEETEPDRKLLVRAQQQYQERLARYRPPPVDRDRLERVRQVVARARKELLAS